MGNQNTRILVYSSLAIVLLAAVWGFRQIPEQARVAQSALRTSLQQEILTLDSAVEASTQALKFQLLDVLKSEGHNHATRAFQTSPFLAAGLLELQDGEWLPSWFSTKSPDEFSDKRFNALVAKWPLSKLLPDQAYFAKMGGIDGQAYFAVLVPVKKPGSELLVGAGIFPASRFGLVFSTDHARDVRVFDDNGFALSLTHPAYLGTQLNDDALVQSILNGSDVSVEKHWKDGRGQKWIGVASELNDSNLFAAVESPVIAPSGGALVSWLYLILSALGAIAINWVLFTALLKPLFLQMAQTEELNEQLKRQLSHSRTEREDQEDAIEMDPLIPAAQLPNLNFQEAEREIETEAEAEAPPVVGAALPKVVRAALRSLDGMIQRHQITVETIGLDDIELAEADPIQLQTALEEILKNAVEAMVNEPERRLTIAGVKTNEGIKVTVQDTGPGIREADLNKIFDPFFSTKDSEGVARGLGLNVARRVIEELDGKIEVHSAPSGTTVELNWVMEAPTAVVTAPAAESVWPQVAIRKPVVRNLH